eukprot:gene10734-11883_t
MAVCRKLRNIICGCHILVIILILSIVKSGRCISLQTVDVLEHAKFNCGAKTVYTVTSEMQCYQRCLRKNNCRIINYKVSDNEVTDGNCEVLEVTTTNGACTSENGMNNWKAITVMRNGKQDTVKKEYESCKEIKEEKLNSSSGVHNLKSGRHYCIMNNSQCGEGGWTLAMKIDGAKETFNVTSPYWESNKVYNIENGVNSFENNEAKFPAFNTLGFTSICLGMKAKNVMRWLKIPQSATSLLSIFQGGNYQQTSLGRTTWMGLINGSSLQPFCDHEGFNVKRNDNTMVARMGLIANQENGCASPDSFIGFGLPSSGSYHGPELFPIFSKISCRNFAKFSSQDQSVEAMGFLLIQ